MMIFIIKAWAFTKGFFTKENICKAWEWGKSFFKSDNQEDESIIVSSLKSKNFRWISFFEESPGVGSSVRLVFIVVCITVLFFWSWSAYDCIKLHKPLPEIPSNVLMFALGLGGSKVLQSTFGEKTH